MVSQLVGALMNDQATLDIGRILPDFRVAVDVFKCFEGGRLPTE